MSGLVMFVFVVHTLYFPVYVGIWIVRRANAYQHSLKNAPSVLALALYVVELALGVVLVVSIATRGGKLYGHQAKLSEAKSNLIAIQAAQTNYHHQHNVYAGGDQAFKLIGWDPDDETRYAYFCGSDRVANTIGDQIEIGPDDNLRVSVATTDQAFTCLARGNVDKDTGLDTWAINHHQDPGHYERDVVHTLPGHSTTSDFIAIPLAILIVIVTVITGREHKRYKAEMAQVEKARINNGA